MNGFFKHDNLLLHVDGKNEGLDLEDGPVLEAKCVKRTVFGYTL